MKKIKNYKDYINEELLFKNGGDIGGVHKKPVTDKEIQSGKAYKKGYKPQHSGITNTAYKIENEKRTERKINLMGSDLNGYNNRHFVESLINTTERYIKEQGKYWKDNIVAYLNALPKEVIEHFDINLEADDLVEDFIKNKFELFKRSYEMFKEIKDYPTRYSE